MLRFNVMASAVLLLTSLLINAQAATAISDLSFKNPELKACVTQSARLTHAQDTDGFIMLRCKLSAPLSLDELTVFPKPATLSLEGSSITHLETLNEFSQLNTIVLKKVHIKQFPEIKNAQLNLILAKSTSDDWPSLVNVQGAMTQIRQPASCSKLKSLARAEQVYLLTQESKSADIAKGMMAVATAQKHPQILLHIDCPANEL